MMALGEHSSTPIEAHIDRQVPLDPVACDRASAHALFMNSVSSVYSSALTGLSAATRRFEVSAHNVANMNTDGFETSGGVKVSISDWVRAKSGTDLIEETVSQTTSSLAFKANLRTLATAQSLDATLLALGATIPDR